MPSHNVLRWDGAPGHYEVHYLTATEPRSATGLWIRFTMLAPLDPSQRPTCSLWLVATFADAPALARKATYPIERLRAEREPFRLAIGDAVLGDHGTSGAIGDAAWELGWSPGRAYEHVAAPLRPAAQTVLVLAHANLRVSGFVTLAGRRIELEDVHAGQAHLWGSKHAARWAWAHCGDFRDADGRLQRGAFLDGVSVRVRRAGRELGPATPVVGRLLDDDFLATSPAALLRARSRFALSSWSLQARAGARRIVAEVDAPRAALAGVAYTDPDGERAYCYNSEVASMRVSVFDRGPRSAARWVLRQTLVSRGTAHFEYGQREPVPGLELALA